MTWRAFKSLLDAKAWGIETNDDDAVSKGEDIIVAPCLAEHVAKNIVEAHNAGSASQREAK
ncbi:hypothetical protein CKO39_18150 [Rhodopseudomonas palustris]|nr:hypothetical protein CKO39_18150 [Rhodopseudomonas palustris]